MITIFGSSIGALWPWFLATIPLGGALLVYLFRAKGVSNPHITSSLFLLEKLPEYLPSRKRFIPPLQFWLELLACLLLALAVSGVFSAETGERVAIVIDNSKSMATLQPSGGSRLESARRIAESDISTGKSTTRFTVLAGNASSSSSPQRSDQPEKRSGSASAALALLQKIQQSHEADRLQATLDTIAGSKRYDAVWVYTDKERLDQSPDTQIKIITIPSDTNSLSNAWIESLSLKAVDQLAPSSAPNSAQLLVKVAAVGPNAQTVSVSAACTDLASGESFSPPPTTLSIRSGTTASATLGPLSRAWSHCRVALTREDSGSRDAISLDDEAWIANSSTPRQIGLFSALSSKELGLQQLPYQILAGEELAQSQRVTQAIYHRTLPEGSSKSVSKPTIPSLLVMPPAGSLLWSNGSVSHTLANSLEVTRWELSHPLLQYVQPTLLSIPSAATITCPDSAKPILFTSAGAFACAGEEGGTRYVITGFEIFPFDGLRSPTISIFTLNAFRWLFANEVRTAGSEQSRGASLPEGTLRMGHVVLPADAVSARMIAPQELSLVSNESRSIVISTPGIVAVRAEGSTTRNESLFAANSFSAEESDISRRHTLRAPLLKARTQSGDQRGPHGVTEGEEKTLFDGTFTLLLLAVLLLDLIRRIATRSRWGNPA
jgi:hypothetical protein